MINRHAAQTRIAQRPRSMLSLAEGTIDETEFAVWLRRHLTMNTQDQVHEPGARYTRT